MIQPIFRWTSFHIRCSSISEFFKSMVPVSVFKSFLRLWSLSQSAQSALSALSALSAQSAQFLKTFQTFSKLLAVTDLTQF